MGERCEPDQRLGKVEGKQSAVDREPDGEGPGEPFRADLTTREANRAAVDAALERFGRLDALVPNAGFQYVAPVEELDEDRWDALLALLLTSPFLLARTGSPKSACWTRSSSRRRR